MITSADKGGKVVAMDNEAYTLKNCEGQLDNKEFYVKLDHDPTTNIVNEINSEIRRILDKKLIDKIESQLLSEHQPKSTKDFIVLRTPQPKIPKDVIVLWVPQDTQGFHCSMDSPRYTRYLTIFFH